MHITDLTGQLPVHPARRYARRPLGRIDAALLHHTAAPPARDCNWPAELARHAAYHVNRHGWPGIGYHYAVAPDGQCFKLNALSTVSYHCPRWNTRSAGIVLLGDFTQQAPDPAQLAALGMLLGELRRGLPALRLLKAHRECRATACPGAAFPVQLLDGLAVQAGLAR
jgi:N-acetylmuramoyl-L-alanine amidase